MVSICNEFINDVILFFPSGWQLSTSIAETGQVAAQCTLVVSSFCSWFFCCSYFSVWRVSVIWVL